MSQPEFQRSQRWIQETQDLPSGPLTPEPASTQPLPQVLPTLFDLVLDSTADTTAATTPRLAAFLEAPTVGKALEVWLDRLLEAGRLPDKQDVSDSLSRDVARLDRLLTEQVNAILHHPKFQQLEAGWRSLEYLVNQVDEDENIKVRVLDVSWAELTRDIDRAIE